jgi:hypothetical protein
VADKQGRLTRNHRLGSVRYQRIRPMPSAGVSFVPSVSVIGTLALKVSKQCQGRPRFTRTALSGYRTPVENDEVGDRYMCDVGTGRLDHPGGLVADKNRVLVGDAAGSRRFSYQHGSPETNQ